MVCSVCCFFLILSVALWALVWVFWLERVAIKFVLFGLCVGILRADCYLSSGV